MSKPNSIPAPKKRDPVISLKTGGIKCDAPRCAWADWAVRRAAYPDYRNKPCPECGANLLTDADWKALLRFERAVRWINRLFFWLPRGNAQTVECVFSSDGTGKVSDGSKTVDPRPQA